MDLFDAESFAARIDTLRRRTFSGAPGVLTLDPPIVSPEVRHGLLATAPNPGALARELDLDLNRLRFVRWLVETGRIADR